MARRTTTAASRSAVLSPDGGALPCSLRRMRRRRASTTHVMRRHPRTRWRRASMTRARRGGVGRRGGAETRRRAREAGAFVALVLVASNQHGDWMQFDRPSSSLSSSSPPCTKNNSLFLHVLHRRAWGKKFVLPRPLRSDSFDVEHLPNLLHLRPHSSSNPVAPIELATELHGCLPWRPWVAPLHSPDYARKPRDRFSSPSSSARCPLFTKPWPGAPSPWTPASPGERRQALGPRTPNPGLLSGSLSLSLI